MTRHTHYSYSDVKIPQLRRLYHWLTYNRLTIFLYGISYFQYFVLLIAIGLAILFAPYVLFVLVSNRKWGWLAFFALFVGIPTGFLFYSTGDLVYDSVLHYSPLGTFYTFCVVLRYSVANWISDNSLAGELEVEEEDKNNNLDELSGKWMSGQQ